MKQSHFNGIPHPPKKKKPKDPPKKKGKKKTPSRPYSPPKNGRFT